MSDSFTYDLFIMGEDQPVKKNDIEKDPTKEAKLNALRDAVEDEIMAKEPCGNNSSGLSIESHVERIKSP